MKVSEKTKVAVLGAINIDFVVNSDTLPRPGETVRGTEFNQFPGGKGANQAVAAAKLGGTVTMVGAVGNDMFGRTLLDNLRKYAIDTGYVRELPTSSGIALILVDRKGQNLISFVSGANGIVDRSMVDDAREVIAGADVLLLQLECPVETVEYAVRAAHSLGTDVILNPAPASSVSDETLKQCAVVMPNETEAEILTGIEVTDEKTAFDAASRLLKKGSKRAIITLGEKGAFLLENAGEKGRLIPAPKVDSIDAVAAGDVFAGALAVQLGRGVKLDEAVFFANHAAALSTTKNGAQPSIPALKDVLAFIG